MFNYASGKTKTRHGENQLYIGSREETMEINTNFFQYFSIKYTNALSTTENNVETQDIIACATETKKSINNI